MAGVGVKLDATGTMIQLTSGDTHIGIAVDPSTDLSAPPSASLVTVVYGSGTKFIVDHATEVAASSATRAYNVTTGCPTGSSTNSNLYFDAVGKWTTTAGANSIIVGKIFQVPAAANNFGLGVILL